MALYDLHGASVTIVGFADNPHKITHVPLLCCRYHAGLCVLLTIDDLRADEGLLEIEAAYRQVLGYSPWNQGELKARVGL